MSNLKSDQQWMDKIQTCRMSGLTDRQWCIQNNVPLSTFYYNARRLRDAGATIKAATGACIAPVKQEVVQIKMNELPDGYSPQRCEVAAEIPAVSINLNGIRMDIGNHADTSLIAATLRAIVAVC